MSAFLASTLLGTVGDDVLMSFKFLKELKADHKIAVRSRVLRYSVITWKGFLHSPKFFRPPLSEIDLERQNEIFVIFYCKTVGIIINFKKHNVSASRN